ncbi:uncharacterized protein C2845_PM02G19850 [Panicum miliaceum]|uniref:Uncharacterized protein n=1 Tax=Panicum miliaceum TaxID=4540 RepID=A0A3L6SDE9_PANMI|nr:uncharacterized protein C2845_PM02G19850 [Panicum miliaceum]
MRRRRRGRRCAAAYDPCAGAWITVPAPRHATSSRIRPIRVVREDRVCELSLSGVAVAGDPLGAAA